jgi:hypothetical protein
VDAAKSPKGILVHFVFALALLSPWFHGQFENKRERKDEFKLSFARASIQVRGLFAAGDPSSRSCVQLRVLLGLFRLFFEAVNENDIQVTNENVSWL